MRLWYTRGIIYVLDTSIYELFFFLFFAPVALIIGSSKQKNYAITFVFCFFPPNVNILIFPILFQPIH